MQPAAEKYDYTSLLVCLPYTRIRKLNLQILYIEMSDLILAQRTIIHGNLAAEAGPTLGEPKNFLRHGEKQKL
jgi:hypothetical protein